jgi:hypothetical protein
MKKAFLIIIIAINLLHSINCDPPKKPLCEQLNTGASGKTGDIIRAFSLKVAQGMLNDCQQKNSCSEDVLKLACINRILGLVVDEKNHDLILFGQTDPDLPQLDLEDFVIALRNAQLKYAPLNANVYQYSDPGCSIDPVAKVLQDLNVIGQKILSSSQGNITTQIESWRNACQQPQQVRVMGVPFNTRFAQIMVKADYDMKTIADGTSAIDAPGFKGIPDMMITRTRNDLVQHRPVVLSQPGLNRFWFYPGENLYEEDEGIVLIKQCPVNLLTEQMHSNKAGQVSGTGSSAPLARVFAQNFTLLYSEVARQHTVYAQLENLFRFVALAKIIKFKYPDHGSMFDLDYLLERYPVAENTVEPQLPGRSSVKEFEHREDFAQGYRSYHLWLPSCGGVDMAIDVNGARFGDSAKTILAQLKASVLNSRPSADSLAWDNKGSNGLMSRIADALRVLKLNRSLKASRAFTVVKTSSGYEVIGENLNPIYEGDNIKDLVAKVNISLGPGSSISNIYFDLPGFSDDKGEAFQTSCRIQQNLMNPGVTITGLPRQEDSTYAQDLLFAHGAQVESGPTSVETVTQGKFKNWFKASFTIVNKVKGITHKVVITVFAASLDVLNSFIQMFTARFSGPDFETASLADIVSQIRRELKKGPDELVVKFEDELGNTYYVRLHTSALANVG